MAYGARLESVLGASPRGFESPILRHRIPGPVEVPGFLYFRMCVCDCGCVRAWACARGWACARAWDCARWPGAARVGPFAGSINPLMRSWALLVAVWAACLDYHLWG